VTDIAMNDITFSFRKGTAILDHFSLSVERGECVYLHGENGSGKSTLLKVLCGAVRPQNGTVSLLGEDPLKHPEVLRHIGVVVDGMGFYGDCTLRENILIFAHEKGISREKAEKELEGYVKQWDIDFSTRYRQGSHGMRKIAQLTLSLLGDPRALIWDEPELALDDKRQAVMLSLLTSYKTAGHTILLAGTRSDFYGSLVDRVVEKAVVV